MDPAARLTAHARIKRAAGLIFAASALAAFAMIDPAAVIKRITCPFQLTTGLPCPLCGMTRALHHLFSGDLARAWFFNPFSFAVGGMVSLLFIRTAAEVLTGRRARPLPPLARPWVATAAVIILIYWAVRIRETRAPSEPPRTPFSSHGAPRWQGVSTTASVVHIGQRLGRRPDVCAQLRGR